MTSGTYGEYVKAHLDAMISGGLDRYGSVPTAQWMASLDTRTGRYPEDDTRPESIGKRVYRDIDAPRGCTLYWDQPQLVAAHAVSETTGDKRYSEAADAYVADFLKRCVADTGIFLWGNHYYYNAFEDRVVRFGGAPCAGERDPGDLHEIRPIVPVWGLFERVDVEITKRAVRAALEGHTVDPATGEFNRHADGKQGCAFLEAGATLVESAAWLYARDEDPRILERAERIAGYSFGYRGAETGLLENNPTVTRWDKHASTTEVGLWAGCLMRAGRAMERPSLIEMADVAMRAWLRHGYDEDAGRYRGRLSVVDGSHLTEGTDWRYMPGEWSDLWEPLFPRHDYPMAMGEACVLLLEETGDAVYREAVGRWVEPVVSALPARGGRGAYAEHYGRCIHFLLRAHWAAGCAGALDLAHRVAREAVDVLHAGPLFRGHPGEERYDAVDGVGYLLLALIALDKGEEPPMMGLGW